MARKSIFIGISDAWIAQNRSAKVGGRFVAQARFCGDAPTPIAGKIVHELPGGDPSNPGKMIFVKPDKWQTDVSHLCARWGIISIWISECGQSGVLCPWKDSGVKELCEMVQFYEDMEEAEVTHRKERQAENCLAL